MHVFDQAITLQAQGDGSFTGCTHPEYANMVGPFGGVSAAQVLQSVLLHPQRLGEPVSFTVNYAAALADGPFTVVARAARTNRSTQHWVVELQQDGQACMTATVVTAVRRETWSLDEAPLPKVPPASEVPRLVRGAPLPWVNRYELRYVRGSFPMDWSGLDTGSSLSQLWMRDADPRPPDFASLTAFADVFFPRVYVRRARRVPIGTVSMTVYFHASGAHLAGTGTGFVLGQAQGQAFRNGFFDQAAQLWNEAGNLLCTSHQIIYFKE